MCVTALLPIVISGKPNIHATSSIEMENLSF